MTPGLPEDEEAVASLQPGLGVFSGMDNPPPQTLATRMWNSTGDLEKVRGFLSGIPDVFVGGYESLRYILICVNAHVSWTRAQCFQHFSRGL